MVERCRPGLGRVHLCPDRLARLPHVHRWESWLCVPGESPRGACFDFATTRSSCSQPPLLQATIRTAAAIAGCRQIHRQLFSRIPTRLRTNRQPGGVSSQIFRHGGPVAYRFAGAFSIALRQIVSRSRGIDARNVRGGGGSQARIWLITELRFP